MNTLLHNWNFARGLRLVISLVFLAAGVSKGDTVAYVAAAFFGIQAILNVGCGGMLCAPASTRPEPEVNVTAVTYEEVH